MAAEISEMDVLNGEILGELFCIARTDAATAAILKLFGLK